MSVTKGVGIPVKLLHEAEGHIVTVRIPVKSIGFRARTRAFAGPWLTTLFLFLLRAD